MSTREPGRAQPGLTPLPKIEDLPASTDGYDRAKVQEAFDSFRRHVTSLQANLRVLQAAPKSGITEPSGHAVRMDALHIVRAAAEFADTIERDAQDAAAKQVGRAEVEIREKQMELQQHEAEIARIRQETERQRTEILSAARKESREILTKSNRDATAELREAEVEGQPPHRAVAPPGDRAHELRARRSGADARLGPRPGRIDRPARPHGRRAAPVGRRPRRRRDPRGRRCDRQGRRGHCRPPQIAAVAHVSSPVEEPDAEPEATEPHDEPALEPEAGADEDELLDESTQDGGPDEDESPAPS